MASTEHRSAAQRRISSSCSGSRQKLQPRVDEARRRVSAGARRTRLVRAFCILLAVAAPLAAIAATTATEYASAARPSAGVERGRYLANDVAMCVQCHTPRNEQGALDETRLFAGATIPIQSPFPAIPWAFQSPALAGGGNFADADILSVLTAGHRRDGKVPSAPMPSFRMTTEDASAVVTYLHSLTAP
jgi:mono/diheme cytochrome c family protein